MWRFRADSFPRSIERNARATRQTSATTARRRSVIDQRTVFDSVLRFTGNRCLASDCPPERLRRSVGRALRLTGWAAGILIQQDTLRHPERSLMNPQRCRVDGCSKPRPSLRLRPDLSLTRHVRNQKDSLESSGLRSDRRSGMRTRIGSFKAQCTSRPVAVLPVDCRFVGCDLANAVPDNTVDVSCISF